MDIPVFVPILAGIMISIIFITTAYLENKKRNSNKENDKKTEKSKTLEEEMEQHRKYVEYENKKVYNIKYINNKTNVVVRNFALKRNQTSGPITPVDVPEICSKIEYYSDGELIIRGDVEDVVFVLNEKTEEKTEEFTAVSTIYTWWVYITPEETKENTTTEVNA